MAQQRHDGLTGALLELDAITRRLRRDCPWDREQDERSIVPHTVEEAYELAEAAHTGDDAKLLDELGDVLFQVYFLSLLLEERGKGDLAAVATGVTDKLVRRHPHVFGDDERLDELPTEAATPAEVRRNWDEIKRSEPGRTAGRRAGADPGQPAEPALRAQAAQARRAVDRPGGLAAGSAALDRPDPRAPRRRPRLAGRIRAGRRAAVGAGRAVAGARGGPGSRAAARSRYVSRASRSQRIHELKGG